MRRYFTGERPLAEYIERESQAFPDPSDPSGRVTGQKADALARTPTGEPAILYDVRCTYDSRPASAYDANFITDLGESAGTFTGAIRVPSGYRAVPRRYKISFNNPPIGQIDQIRVFVQAYGADLPNNVVLVGAGITFDTFFLVEENSTFGARVVDPDNLITGSVYLEVWANLLPVTGVALPFEVTNRKV